MIRKQRARATIQQRLQAIEDEQFALLSEKVYTQTEKVFVSYCRKDNVRSVLLYVALPEQREVAPSRIEQMYPSISFDYVSPKKDVPLPIGTYDIIFVPLFGFNAGGYRLGRGGGWYDRLLARQPQAVKIGVGLEAGRIDFAAETHDIPMDVIVTERFSISGFASGRETVA